ncbi:glutathione peroxidase [Mycena filopes]|nr:glutathione peroxidase [Mycena filopes]
MSTFYTLKATKKNGDVLDFSEFKGKTVLVVNVASACGFTPQYKGLQALYEKYKDRDFTIIGFPCNQFGGQEPGTDEEIATFCEVNHGVTFPLVKKTDVNGDNANEVFKWLKSEKSGILGLARIKVCKRALRSLRNLTLRQQWNFEKFLINKEGVVVNRWASTTTPEAIDAEVAKIV